VTPEEEAQIRDDARATPDAPLRPGWAARQSPQARILLAAVDDLRIRLAEECNAWNEIANEFGTLLNPGAATPPLLRQLVRAVKNANKTLSEQLAEQTSEHERWQSMIDIKKQLALAEATPNEQRAEVTKFKEKNRALQERLDKAEAALTKAGAALTAANDLGREHDCTPGDAGYKRPPYCEACEAAQDYETARTAWVQAAKKLPLSCKTPVQNSTQLGSEYAPCGTCPACVLRAALVKHLDR
jgi:hypothetical protein